MMATESPSAMKTMLNRFEIVLDIHRGYDIQSTHGVTLHQDRNAACPERFVQHQRCSFDEDLFRQSRRNTDRAVQMLRKTIFFFVSVRADQHDRHLHVTGQHRCDCRADNAELRCTEFSVD